jgi:hypothetical protein
VHETRYLWQPIRQGKCNDEFISCVDMACLFSPPCSAPPLPPDASETFMVIMLQTGLSRIGSEFLLLVESISARALVPRQCFEGN